MDEEQIENMSWLFFEAVLEELGRKLNYDAVVNYGGNSFAKDSWKMIMDANPMSTHGKDGGIGKGIAAMIGKANIKTIKASGKGSEGHGRIEDIGKGK